MFSKISSAIKGVANSIGGDTDSDPEVGTEHKLGNYTVVIEKVLAQGGFAKVYLAKDHSGQTYALKKILAGDVESRKCTEKEIKIMTKFKECEFVVTMFAWDMKQKGKFHEYYILMELCTGGHLVDFMNTRLENRPTEAEILKIFGNICEGLAPLHQNTPPIIHRDIKLENVLLSGQTFKLCDFGSATTEAVMPGETCPIPVTEEELQKYTTLPYRAPEMVDLYVRKKISEKADIWAMGCLLYKLCFFEDAFGESPLAILGCKYKVPDNHGYSAGLIKLLGGLLDGDPETRLDVATMSAAAFKLMGKPCPIKQTRNRSQSSSSATTTSPSPTQQKSNSKDDGSWACFGSAPAPTPTTTTATTSTKATTKATTKSKTTIKTASPFGAPPTTATTTTKTKTKTKTNTSTSPFGVPPTTTPTTATATTTTPTPFGPPPTKGTAKTKAKTKSPTPFGPPPTKQQQQQQPKARPPKAQQPSKAQQPKAQQQTVQSTEKPMKKQPVKPAQSSLIPPTVAPSKVTTRTPSDTSSISNLSDDNPFAALSQPPKTTASGNSLSNENPFNKLPAQATETEAPNPFLVLEKQKAEEEVKKNPFLGLK